MDGAVRTVVFFVLLVGVRGQEYIVPKATLELLNPGLRISIPGTDPSIRLVTFHINVNKEFRGLEQGHYSANITRKTNGRWTYSNPDFRLRPGDLVYYWIHVVVDKQSVNRYEWEYKVVQVSPSGEGSTFTTLPVITDRIPIQTPIQTLIQTPIQTLSCKMSQSTRNGRSVCQGEVLLDKRFDSMDGWNHQVTIGGSYPEDEFMVFSKDYYNSWLENGRLFIRPSLLEERYNELFVKSGELRLQGCTSSIKEQCIRQALSYLILPPIASARLNTKNSFIFRYGIVEIKAKLPSGEWIVPELWLEAVSGGATGRVVLGLSRGNKDNSEFGGRNLEAGVLSDSQPSFGKMFEGVPWSQGFHIFKLLWTPEYMQFFVDNRQIHQITSRYFSILNKEVYITLGAHVAGGRDFHDNINNKPWKNSDPKRFVKFWESKENWHPSWDQDSSLQIEHIRITAL